MTAPTREDLEALAARLRRAHELQVNMNDRVAGRVLCIAVDDTLKMIDALLAARPEPQAVGHDFTCVDCGVLLDPGHVPAIGLTICYLCAHRRRNPTVATEAPPASDTEEE